MMLGFAQTHALMYRAWIRQVYSVSAVGALGALGTTTTGKPFVNDYSAERHVRNRSCLVISWSRLIASTQSMVLWTVARLAPTRPPPFGAETSEAP